jgi:translation initiation factor 2 beta subunit (eIF-2beta)/eIF-5
MEVFTMSAIYDRMKRYNEEYKSSLKPCPVCGNVDVNIQLDREIFGNHYLWFVACSTPNCECTKSYKPVKDAIDAWNNM